MEHYSDYIKFWAEWVPEKIALRFEGAEVTWAEIDERTDRLAAGLAAEGLKRGDRLGILLENCPSYVEAVFAGIKLGLVIVPLNVRLTSYELAHPIRNSGMRAVVSSASFADRLVEATCPDAPAIYLVDEKEGSRSLSALYRDGQPPVLDSPDSEEPLFLCYTAGTTGLQKGVILTHHNVRAAGLAKVLAEGIGHDDALLLPYSLAFTGGVVSCLAEICLLSGATLVLESDFDPDRCLEMIAEGQITIITGVPIILERLARAAKFESTDLSSLRSATTGGSPVSDWLLAAYQSRGVQLTQSYGLTEASGGVTYLSSRNAARKAGSAGRPALHNRIRVVDNSDVDRPAGEVGEILVQGPSVMREYWGLAEATETALRGGWLHTGDMGVLDEEGYLSVVDRSKDMLISGGINVYPAEIESSLMSVPGMEDFAVIGIPDDRWGEVPMLVVGLKPDQVDIEAIESHCRVAMASFKRPKHLVFHGEQLPRNLGGKILKGELRDKYKQVPDGAISLRTSSTAE